jgi:hypothetical protein
MGGITRNWSDYSDKLASIRHCTRRPLGRITPFPEIGTVSRC